MTVENKVNVINAEAKCLQRTDGLAKELGSEVHDPMTLQTLVVLDMF